MPKKKLSIDRVCIYNEDCLTTIRERLKARSIDIVLTSPPYNMTKRKGGVSDTGRYDVYTDWKTEEEYCEWTYDIFNNIKRVLKDDGVILYNFSYSIENPSLPYKIVVGIEQNTNFRLVDTIIWKKKNGIPFPANRYRLSRVCEFVFVFVDKGHMNDYTNNRHVKSISAKTGQAYYDVHYNFVEAANNDGRCSLNQATFSSDLVIQLLSMYCNDESKRVVYDPFMGTGTTAVGCLRYSNKIEVIGSEISQKQCNYINKRVKNETKIRLS